MRYNLAQLLKEPIGSERIFHLDKEFKGPDRFAEMLRGPVHVVRTHHGVLVRAVLESRAKLQCSRCLADFVRPSTLEIEEEFFPTVDVNTGRTLAPRAEERSGFRIDSQHVLDLMEAVREYVVTDAPMKPLCIAGCQGLCQECGANLNLGQCDCEGSGSGAAGKAFAVLLRKDGG